MLKLLTTFVFLNSATVYAYQYETLNRYDGIAQNLLKELEATSIESTINNEKVEDLLNQLVESGTDIMKLYAEKRTECQDQYLYIYSELPAMENLTFKEVHDKYHDGKGLPNAPRICYLGRSQVVHPVLTKIILKDGWNAEIKEEAIHETEEVIEHLIKIENILNAK